MTPSQVPLQAVLFTKSDCSLCVKAESVLARVARDVPLEVRVVKIPMSDRRADRVPIVEIGGVEVQSQKVSEFRLRNWLKERGFRNATR